MRCVGCFRSLHLLVFWILFENVMSLHRTKATIIGLLEAGRVNEWVVTEKLGDAMKHKSGKQTKKSRSRIGERYCLCSYIVPYSAIVFYWSMHLLPPIKFTSHLNHRLVFKAHG